MARLALLILCLTIGACASTKPPLIVKPERIPPVQAMEPCKRQLCELRETFSSLTLEDQAAMILACRIADAEAYRTCDAKHSALVDFIGR